VCHNGNVGNDLNLAFGLFSTHPVSDYVAVHQAGEDVLTMFRHVECVDRHNAHKINLKGESMRKKRKILTNTNQENT